MLIGYEGAATALVKLLRDKGAETARVVEKTMGIPAGTITTPAPEDVHPVWVDVVSKGRFPTWMVVSQDTPLRRTAGHTGLNGDSDEVEFRYPFSIVSHVVGKDEADVALQRYRLMMVIRVLLLQYKLIIKTDSSKAVVDIHDMQEIVGGMAQQGERYLVEGRNDFHVLTTELIPAIQQSWGPVSSIDFTVEQIPMR